MSRLCIFCGAHSGTDAYRASAAQLAASAVQRGYGIVYGGGRVGLMGIVADSALAAGGEVIGVIPEALASAEIAHSGVTRLHVVGSMHERKALMAQLSDAFVALPGGFGTMDEFHEILTWRQLGIHDKPIVLFNDGGYYDDLLRAYDRMERDGFLKTQTRRLFTVASTIDDVFDAIASASS